jgi:hypothetical protein
VAQESGYSRLPTVPEGFRIDWNYRPKHAMQLCSRCSEHKQIEY